MKISLGAIACLGLSTTSVGAFAPSTNSQHRITTQLNAAHGNWLQKAQQTAVTAAVAASLWTAPAFMDSTGFTQTTSSATAKEMASGSGSRVNKDAESLLRYGLPINNKEVRQSLFVAKQSQFRVMLVVVLYFVARIACYPLCTWMMESPLLT